MHLPEEKLDFVLCTEVNSHALHPGQTPVPDASKYYSLRYTTTTRAPPKNTGSGYGSILSFQKHCNYVTDRIDKRNNMIKALAGSSWGPEKETLLRTYNALEKYIASYAAPVWNTNASDSSFKEIQTGVSHAKGQ